VIEVRPATPAEYTAIGELTAGAYLADGAVKPDDPYLALLRDAAGRAEGAELWVAVDGDGAFLGTVTRCPPGSRYRELGGESEGEFRALAVAPEGRGRGVGALLVELCLERAVDDGATSMVISTAEWMTTAHRLYRRLGFVPAPERDWWPRPDVHLLAFVRPLP
jgi:ribosomal protein S18 acetylase RimI-like enzyme